MRSRLAEDFQYAVLFILTSQNNNILSSHFLLDNTPVADYCSAHLCPVRNLQGNLNDRSVRERHYNSDPDPDP